MTAVGAIARKMCNIIFTILRENRPYEAMPPKKGTVLWVLEMQLKQSFCMRTKSYLISVTHLMLETILRFRAEAKISMKL